MSGEKGWPLEVENNSQSEEEEEMEKPWIGRKLLSIILFIVVGLCMNSYLPKVAGQTSDELKELNSKGADLNTKSNDSYTALLLVSQNGSKADTDKLEPIQILFMEQSYTDDNGNFLEKPSPIYKDGIKLFDGSTINLKEGWRFVHVSVEYQNLEDTKLSIDLNQILVESDNGPTITCSAYGPPGFFIPYVHGRTSEGSFAPKSNTYFYTKFEWKNNVVTYSGLRRKLVFFNIVFAVPNSLDMKTISWYGKPLTERHP